MKFHRMTAVVLLVIMLKLGRVLQVVRMLHLQLVVLLVEMPKHLMDLLVVKML